jgi:hypothetical protein
MALTPGPFHAVDLGDPNQPPSPPVFASLAQAFADALAPLHTALDLAFEALLAETLLDVGAGFADDLTTLTAAAPAAGAPLDPTDLNAAARAYSEAYGQVVQLHGMISDAAVNALTIGVRGPRINPPGVIGPL